ncbi:MAG TPA: PAS domain S-box protein, partial [Nitrospira sp.]
MTSASTFTTIDIRDAHRSRQIVKNYALALGMTFAALLARFGLDPFLGDHLPYATFLVAVAVSTWYAGLGPSLTSMVLGGLAADWFFMSPRQSLFVVGVMQQVGYLTYFTMCLALVGFGHAARRARQQSEQVMDGLRREVLERERAEEALRDLLLQYQSTFDNAAVGMSHVGLDGRWLKVNDRLCDITGYSRDELLAGKFGDITHSLDLEADWAQARRLVAGEIATYSMEKRYLHKTGSIVWIYLTVSLVRDADGRPKHFISIINDITERKLAEEELARAKRRTETILESAGEAVYGLSADGLSTFINPATAQMFGYRVDELLGRNTHDILHHSHLDGRVYPVRDCPIYASLTDGTTHRADDEVFWHKDGRAIAVSYTSTPLWDGNRLSGAVVVLRDIRARKQAEKALRESQERLQSFAGRLEQLVEERTQELVQSQERLRALATELNLAEQRERKRLASDL